MPLRVNELLLKCGGARNCTCRAFNETGTNRTVPALISGTEAEVRLLEGHRSLNFKKD